LIARIGGKEVNVNTVSIIAKCSDLCFTKLKSNKGEVLIEHDGYVPDFFPEDHYGDYVQLDIDMDTGRILNWKITKKAVQETITKWEEKDNER
jgi:hypothetical protein